MKKIFTVVGLLLCHIQLSYADNGLFQFGKQYSEVQARLQSDPKSLLDELLISIKASSENEMAYNNLLISQAYYALVFPEKSLVHAQLGLGIVSEDRQPLLYHRLQLALAMAHDISGNSSKGLKGVNGSLNWAKKNHNLNLTIESLTTSGYLYLSLGEYVSSLKALQQAYQLAMSNNNFPHEEIAGIIALVYEYRRENELSIPFFVEVSDYHRKNNNWLELSIALYGLGKAHLATGKVELGKKELLESAKVSVKVSDFQGEGYALKELAGFEIGQGNYEQAEVMLFKSLNAFELAKNSLMLFDTYKILSQLKLKANQVEKAQEYLEKAMDYIDKDKQPSQYLAIENQATEILAYKGNYEKAFKDLRKILIKEKRLISKKSTLKLHQLRSKFELESKDNENRMLSQEVELKNTKLSVQKQKHQVLQLFFVFAITVIGLLIYIAFRIRKNKMYYENLANYDGLTGVYTRSKTLSLLNKAFQYSKENNQNMCVGMIDLDYFKNINDQFGHATGDLVLKEVGRFLIEIINNTDICGRFGGEEFVVGLINTSTHKGKEKFEEIRSKIEAMHEKLNNKDLKVTLSAGFCNNLNLKDIDEMIKSADDALYKAKENGRNKIVYNLNLI